MKCGIKEMPSLPPINPWLWFNHRKENSFLLWKQELKIPRALCVRSIILSVLLLYTGKTSNLIKELGVGGQDISCLRAWLKVLSGGQIHLYFFVSGKVIERRSSVPSNHNASFPSVLSIYSNKWWFTNTHSLWLIELLAGVALKLRDTKPQFLFRAD